MMRTVKAAVLAFVLPFALAASFGCANQAEGERCDRRNNNEDCESGLVCTSKETLKSNSDLCCPPAPQLPSVAECAPGSGGGATPDASTGGNDAGTGSPDASEPSDAASDASEEDAETTEDAEADVDDAATD